MKAIMTNIQITFKGLKLFGLVISTKKAIRKCKITCDDLIINPTKKQLNILGEQR